MASNPIGTSAAGPSAIRIIGDPVLTTRASEVDDVDGALATLTGEMLTVMYEAPGLGLAAPQVGVSRRFFVYDVGEGPAVLINPEIVESEGEWSYAEGCLSIPELTFDVVRPKRVHMTGRDLDGNEVSIEADDLLARLFQHEIDHLNGVLYLDHLDDEQAREARRFVRDLRMRTARPVAPGVGELQLP